MERIKIETFENFEAAIKEMKLNTFYDLPENCRYRYIKFEMSEGYYDKKIYFTWSMEYNYYKSGSTGYIYPSAGSNKVAHFKTEKGAKQNFLRQYKDYFEQLKTESV